METLIRNQSMMSGAYGTEDLDVYSSLAEVTLVEGISAEKTANRTVWANGDLMYTVVITNETEEDYVNPVFTDELDDLIVLVPDSFKVADTEYPSTFADNKITATLPTIPGGGSLTITFLVRKA